MGGLSGSQRSHRSPLPSYRNGKAARFDTSTGGKVQGDPRPGSDEQYGDRARHGEAGFERRQWLEGGERVRGYVTG